MNVNAGDLVRVHRALGRGYTIDFRDHLSNHTIAVFEDSDVALVLCVIKRNPLTWFDQALVVCERGIGRLKAENLEVIK